MTGFIKGAAVLISILIGLIILPFLGIKGLFAMVVIGFIANYITIDSQRSYKIGAAAGFIIGIIVFIYGFFVSPVLPDIPDISGFKMLQLKLNGLLTLLLGFIVLIAVCTGFGAIGGAIVQKLFKKKPENRKPKEKRAPKKSFNSKSRMTLKKNKSQKKFNSKRRTLNKK